MPPLEQLDVEEEDGGHDQGRELRHVLRLEGADALSAEAATQPRGTQRDDRGGAGGDDIHPQHAAGGARLFRHQVGDDDGHREQLHQREQRVGRRNLRYRPRIARQCPREVRPADGGNGSEVQVPETSKDVAREEGGADCPRDRRGLADDERRLQGNQGDVDEQHRPRVDHREHDGGGAGDADGHQLEHAAVRGSGHEQRDEDDGGAEPDGSWHHADDPPARRTQHGHRRPRAHGAEPSETRATRVLVNCLIPPGRPGSGRNVHPSDPGNFVTRARWGIMHRDVWDSCRPCP